MVNEEFNIEQEGRRIKIERAITFLQGTRYFGLAKDVLEKLPSDWDNPREYVFHVVDTPPPNPDGLGCSRLQNEEEWTTEPVGLQGHEEQVWDVTLYASRLDQFSDGAVKWVIAHELGHVASGLPCGTIVIGRVALTKSLGATNYEGQKVYQSITQKDQDFMERAANLIARAWGFWEEEKTFYEETKS